MFTKGLVFLYQYRLTWLFLSWKSRERLGNDDGCRRWEPWRKEVLELLTSSSIFLLVYLVVVSPDECIDALHVFMTDWRVYFLPLSIFSNDHLINIIIILVSPYFLLVNHLPSHEKKRLTTAAVKLLLLIIKGQKMPAYLFDDDRESLSLMRDLDKVCCLTFSPLDFHYHLRSGLVSLTPSIFCRVSFYLFLLNSMWKWNESVHLRLKRLERERESLEFMTIMLWAFWSWKDRKKDRHTLCYTVSLAMLRELRAASVPSHLQIQELVERSGLSPYFRFLSLFTLFAEWYFEPELCLMSNRWWEFLGRRKIPPGDV